MKRVKYVHVCTECGKGIHYEQDLCFIFIGSEISYHCKYHHDDPEFSDRVKVFLSTESADKGHSLMRTIAVVQARLNSSRLPGKAVMQIAGRAMLAHVIERAAAIPGIHGLCLAIPYGDLALSQYAEGHYIATGPEDDVLARFLKAAEITNAERIVRVTADCPLFDPEVAGAVLRLHDTEPGALYASNVYPTRTWPDGLDAEVITSGGLLLTDLFTIGDSVAERRMREHVTPYLQHVLREKALSLPSGVDMGRWKWSVDTPVELEFVRLVMEHLPPGAYRMADTMEAIRKAGLWDYQPESDDWKRTQS